jgi:hypothetical protein
VPARGPTDSRSGVRRKSGGTKQNSSTERSRRPVSRRLAVSRIGRRECRPRCTDTRAPSCHKPCRAADRRRHSRSTIALRLPSRTGRHRTPGSVGDAGCRSPCGASCSRTSWASSFSPCSRSCSRWDGVHELDAQAGGRLRVSRPAQLRRPARRTGDASRPRRHRRRVSPVRGRLCGGSGGRAVGQRRPMAGRQGGRRRARRARVGRGRAGPRAAAGRACSSPGSSG